jgi:signal transduction histidine kinase
MRGRQEAMSLFKRQRPVLRMQLTLLYSGLFVGLLAAVLLAISFLFGTTNVLFDRTSSRAPAGAAAAQHAANGRHLELGGPGLIVLAAIAIALVVAWGFAGRFLRPLRVMTTAALEISATNLHRRLSVGGPDDELTELGRTLNSLFGRLEDSFESQRHFVANASHELRTPLAGQRTLLQVALADPRPTPTPYGRLAKRRCTSVSDQVSWHGQSRQGRFVSPIRKARLPSGTRTRRHRRRNRHRYESTTTQKNSSRTSSLPDRRQAAHRPRPSKSVAITAAFGIPISLAPLSPDAGSWSPDSAGCEVALTLRCQSVAPGRIGGI